MNYGSTRQTLLDNGYLPIPVMGKKPALDNWRENIAPEGYGGYNTGILCGSVVAIDIDVLDAGIADQISTYAKSVCGETVYRVGKAPKVLLVYRNASPEGRKRVSKRYDCGRVEVLGEGQQFVAFGTHPDTKQPYTWPGLMGSILDVSIDRLPQVNDSQITDILHRFKEIAEAAGYRPVSKESELAKNCEYDPTDPLDRPEIIQDLTIERCKKILASIDPDCSRDEWRNLGMAMHYQFKGSPEALALWDEWSSKGTKYKSGEPEKQWDSFGQYSGRPLSGAYLLKQEKKEPVKNYVFAPTWENRPEKTTPLLTLNRVPILSRGNISMITAFAGSGKSSILEAALASMHNPDADTFGLKFQAVNAVMIDTERSYEDHHSSWRRYMKRSGFPEGSPIPENVKWFNIRGIPTIADRLVYLREILSNPPEVLLLDVVSDFIADVNDAEACVSLVNELCAAVHNHSTGILLTMHTNPGINTTKARGVLGSELWRKCQFSGIIQKLDDGVRCLTTEFDLGKNRSGSDSLKTYFKWDDAVKMHRTCAAPAQGRPGRSAKINSQIIENMKEKRFTHSELCSLVMALTGVQKRASIDRINTMVSAGMIEKTSDGHYYAKKSSFENVDLTICD
jgi:hypothetical protein